MARQWRIEFPGALYHVISRGNGLQDIFLSKEDRYLFLDLLKDLSERFNIDVFAYVLMDNHYHLLLKTPDANLSKGMQWFGTTYTRRFNLINSQRGHLFQGRFKSIIVENDAYLLRLSYYIHRNPLRAGIIDRLAEYKWSSYPYYAYRTKAPSWLKTKLILSQLSGQDQKLAYRRKVQRYADESSSIWEDVRHGLVYGSEKFLDDLKSQFLQKQKDVELPQHNRLFRDVDPNKMLMIACKVLKIDLENIRNSRRISDNERDQRDFLIYMLWESGRYSNRQIGSLLGLGYSNVSRRISGMKRRIEKDKRLRKNYHNLKAQIKV